MTIGERGGEPEASVCAAGGLGRQRRRLGYKRGQRVVVAQLSARLREEMERGIPAPGDADEIAIEPAGRATRERRNVDCRDALAAVRTDNRGSGEDRQAEGTGVLRQRSDE